jgi:hypothetical protein
VEADLAIGLAPDKVFLMNPGIAVLGGIRFVGCTLWTDYMLFGREGFAQAMAEASVGLNDHRVIRTRTGCKPGHSRPFTPEDAFDRDWLEARLEEPFDGPTVVVSHHCPSPRRLPERFRADPMRRRSRVISKRSFCGISRTSGLTATPTTASTTRSAARA